MSADTTVVIAAYIAPHGQKMWTAKVVQAAENLLGEDNDALESAKLIFLGQYNRGLPWFSKLPRAKQFATILAQEQEEVGMLEYEKMIVVEFSDSHLQQLSYRKGNPVGNAYYHAYDSMRKFGY